LKISFSSAICGAGKTHQIVNRACELAAAGNNALIVQPTKQLIDRTVERELLSRPNPPDHKVFHGDKYPGNVAKELMAWLKAFGGGGGQIVFITHQLLPHIPYFPNKQDWRVFVDEARQIHDRHTLRIPHSHSTITSYLGLESYNAIYSRLVCGNANAMTDIAQNRDNDAIFEVLSQAARDVKNLNWECYVNTEDFERLLRGEAKELDIYTVLSPTIFDGFRSVFIASANFRDTTLYHLWRQRGLAFEDDVDFARSLQFDQHVNGECIKIFYAIDQHWSRWRQRETWPECANRATLELLAKSAVDFLGNKPFVWQTNKSDSDALRPLFGGNMELPHLAHGLNDYSQINNAILLTASNPTPDQYRFLRNQGMDGDDVRRAIYFHNAYQTILRTSIRDPNNIEPKLIIVPDLALAEHLQQLFPGSRIERLQTGIPAARRQAKVGRPRTHRNDSERKTQYRQKMKLKLMRSMLLLDGDRPYVSGAMLDGQSSGDETPIDIITEFRLSSSYQGTVFTNKYSPTGGYIIGTNVDEFIGWLGHLFPRQVTGKGANQLISPAIFDPNHATRDGSQSRGLGNIVQLRHLWLDFENGDLAPDELPKLFPNIRMVVMNSYRHHVSKPRFHVFIPVRQPLTPDAYEALWDIIAEKLEDAGYAVRHTRTKQNATHRQSGLDRSKRTPTSLYYLPCQAQEPDQSFFADYNGDKRAILDAELWLGNTVIAFRQPPPEADARSTKRNQAMVVEATENWRQSSEHEHEGNDRFFQYAFQLRASEMNLIELEAKLYEEVSYAKTPEQRRKQIPWIIKSLRTPRCRAG
jgi:hypothetical protein